MKKIKHCAACGKELDAKRSTKKYCSDKCRVYKKRDTSSAAPKKDDWVRRQNQKLKAKGLPLIEEELEVYHFISSGVPEIDSLTQEFDMVQGIGGFPRKRITEIFGPKGVGKTSLIKFIMEANPELRVIFVDAEGGLISPPENVHVLRTTEVETIESVIFDAIQEKEVDLVIVDSLAALTTAKELDDGKENMGGIAKAIAKFVRRCNAILRPLDAEGYPDKEEGTAMVIINQLRSNFSQYGPPEYTPGGSAMEYAASLRLDLRSNKSDKLVKGKEYIGQTVKVTVKKSRFGPTDVVVKFKIMYDKLTSYDDYYKERMREILGG